MPIIISPAGFGRTYQQSAKAGMSVTANATIHTMGNWATLIDPVSYNVFGVTILGVGVATAATNTSMLANVGIGPTGGGSEQIVIPYLDMGAAYGKAWFFPLFIPAGKALRAQCQAVITGDILTAIAHTYELPDHGFAEDAPQEWVQYGADSANSRGTAVTSGAAAFGTEVQVTASTSRNHRWFHVGLSLGANTDITTGRYRVRLARDTGATEVIGIWEFSNGAAEEMNGPFPITPVCMPIPSGSPLYVDVDGAAAEALTVIVYAA